MGIVVLRVVIMYRTLSWHVDDSRYEVRNTRDDSR